MKHTPDDRRRMRARALREVAKGIKQVIKDRAWLEMIAKRTGWGKVNDDLRREVLFLFTLAADCVEGLAMQFETGRPPRRAKR